MPSDFFTFGLPSIRSFLIEAIFFILSVNTDFLLTCNRQAMAYNLSAFKQNLGSPVAITFLCCLLSYVVAAQSKVKGRSAE